MDDEGVVLCLGEDGVLHLYEEPYTTIECKTKEDYDRLNELLEKGRKYEAEVENKSN